ncbi:MAG: 8-amino-7-oxononanoate synthase [Nitrospinaceae bacterium]|nr:8-amino-7-oxononanoate synthase [Nitrospinaceae bacterium]MBT3434792.1 8-amino-7-oxononanoate synthase [Nitrospinaceae bacterium]MBT3822006.1 8-amino-7-oxononanoate synthase [Nitrospinaceae bacterium]MBT4094735.1 8-amino-7-oxononanoate synthase [Nitrospinaceae bacterium]MBT4432491.1 8-amino-7-oxononanoate synthase [Nitrospinaceae bacterium]
MATNWRDSILEDLGALSDSNLRRKLRLLSGAQGPLIHFEGREVIHLAGNNYLGLADHPALADAAAKAASEWGSSAAASPLISGYMEPHEALSRQLAQFKDKEAAILFGSGFLANLGLISSLAGEGDAIFSDKLNHASITDGCRLSRAKVHVFAHSDMNDLEDKLDKATGARRRLIVVDGVFSMDGDLAPLDDLAALAECHDAILLVDEAHATGVIGPEGKGAAAHFGVQSGVGVSMGTLGKALASYGAFACSDFEVIDYLVNRARTFIYSTALPPGVLAAAGAAIELASGEEGARRRGRLADLCGVFRAGLEEMGFEMPGRSGDAEVPIFPIIVGEAKDALALADHMLDAGVFLLAIRPPTVPEGTCRLRATLTATHTAAQIGHVLDALESGIKKLGIGPQKV